MDFKKLTRNPLLYVALIAVFLIIGFTLMSSLGGAKQITTQQGLDLLAGNTVTEVVNTDGDQRVDMTLSTPFAHTAGSVTLKKRRTGPAPSSSAAS